MIIFGTRPVGTTISNGQFHCPHCNRKSPYRLRKQRQFFTLYFIPLIPLGSKGEYVECRACNNTFYTSVLEDPVAPSLEVEILQEIQFQSSFRDIILSMILIDGKINEEEKMTAMALINKYASTETFLMKQMDELLDQHGAKDKQVIMQNLVSLEESLSDNGKKILLKSAIEVAQADGDIDEQEQNFIYDIGENLNISIAQIKTLMEEKQAQNN